MNKEEYIEESPYCEICGHCGEIGCCGIRNFIEEHIEGKTNCKNEGIIINELIDLCDYKDEIFEENKQLKEEKEELKKWLEYKIEMLDKFNITQRKETGAFWFSTMGEMQGLLDKIKELEEGVK